MQVKHPDQFKIHLLIKVTILLNFLIIQQIESVKLGTEIGNTGISSNTFKTDSVIHPVKRGNEHILKKILSTK